jgi:hypothetical protein
VENVTGRAISLNNEEKKIVVVETVERTYTIEDVQRRLRMIDREKDRNENLRTRLEAEYNQLIEEENRLKELLETAELETIEE